MLSRMEVADLIASIPQPEATGPKPAKRRSRYSVAATGYRLQPAPKGHFGTENARLSCFYAPFRVLTQ